MRIRLCILLAGCTSDKEDSGSALSGDLVLTDSENYVYAGVLDVDAVAVDAGQDLTVDWSALGTDLRGRPVVPVDVAQLVLVAFVPSQTEVLAAVAANNLPQSDVADYRLFLNDDGVSSALLSEFSILGNDFDPSVELVDRDGIGSRAVIVEDVVEGRTDILSLIFLTLVDSGGAASANIDDATAALDFQATLGDSLRTSVGLNYTLDWSSVTTDGAGNAFDPSRADRLFIGHTSESTDAEIEDSFLSLLDDADAVYREDVYAQTSAELGAATDEEGTAFPGFTADGAWLIGLECTDCTSPAPLALARVVVQ